MSRTTSVLVLLLLASTAIADEPKKKEELTAKQILERMAKTYAECKTYRDTGNVKTVYFQENGKRTENRPFTTAFVRPDRFRFEFRTRRGDEEQDRFIVWREGKVVQTWWDIQPGIKKPASIGASGAGGISGGSSDTVPSLLLPEELGGNLTLLSEAKRVDDAKLDKADCFRVEGMYFTPLPLTLWIDKKSYLIRRIDAQKKFAKFRTEQSTTYEPVVDREIPEKLLEFDAPKQK